MNTASERFDEKELANDEPCGKKEKDPEEEPQDEDGIDDGDGRDRVEKGVRGQDGGDRAGRAHHGEEGHRVHGRLRRRRAHPSEQVEPEVSSVPHRVFDVVAEDPEKEHVPEDVRQVGVHEHAREDGLHAEDGVLKEKRAGTSPQVSSIASARRPPAIAIC